VRLERTEYMKTIDRIAHHPSVFPFISDDAGDQPMPDPRRVHYLLVRVDEPISESGVKDEVVGFVAFYPENYCTMVPHIALLPEHRGRGVGTEALQLAAQWVFANTPCRKLVARPAENNRAMIRVFEKCGFRYEGTSTRSLLRKGELFDRICFGLEKG
jgi:RimJ/RimL family protein N-acetyltransferase